MALDGDAGGEVGVLPRKGIPGAHQFRTAMVAAVSLLIQRPVRAAREGGALPIDKHVTYSGGRRVSLSRTSTWSDDSRWPMNFIDTCVFLGLSSANSRIAAQMTRSPLLSLSPSRLVQALHAWFTGLQCKFSMHKECSRGISKC